MEKKQYIAPALKVVSFKVESGFALSGIQQISTTYATSEIENAPDYEHSGFLGGSSVSDNHWDF